MVSILQDEKLKPRPARQLGQGSSRARPPQSHVLASEYPLVSAVQLFQDWQSKEKE